MLGRLKRHKRIRRKVSGTTERPRLSVSRSLKNIQAQLIDDTKGRSILGVSSLCAQIRNMNKIENGKCGISKEVGRLLAEKAQEQNITQVVFDRGGYLYHGRVKELAEGAKEGGLEF